jgi:hypothetical protein
MDKMPSKFLFAFLSLITVSPLFSSAVTSSEVELDRETSLQKRKDNLIQEIITSSQETLSPKTKNLPSWVQLLAHLSEIDQDGPPENIDSTKGKALLSDDYLKEIVRRIYRNNQESLLTANRQKTSPIPLGWLVHTFPQALSEEHTIEVFIQTFYPDAATSSLNLFTGEGLPSEVIAQRITGYLICQEIIARGPENTGSAPLITEAQNHLENLFVFLRQTVQNAYRTGIEDWDSSATYPTNISAWLTLFDNATNPEIREYARAMLDWYATTIALRTMGNTFGGPESHSDMESSLHSLASLWWGNAHQSISTLSDKNGLLFYASLSHYQPPAVTQTFANKTTQKLYGQYQESKPLNSKEKDTAAWQSRVNFYVGPTYSLGASVVRPTGGWTQFDSQEILWKLVAINSKEHLSNWVVTGAPGRDPWRQVSQWKNVLFDIWHTSMNASAFADKAHQAIEGKNNHSWFQAWQKSFNKRFPGDRVTPNPVKANQITINERQASLSFHSAGSSLYLSDQIVFVQLDQTYLAIRSINEASPILHRTSKRTVLSDPVPLDWFGGFIMEVGSQSDYSTLSDFQTAINQNKSKVHISANRGKIDYTNLSGERIQFSYNTQGSYTEPIYNWNSGDPLLSIPDWPTGKGHGRVPTVLINQKEMPVPAKETVYEGPGLTLQNGILTIEIDDDFYQVDFSEEQPIFTESKTTSSQP